MAAQRVDDTAVALAGAFGCALEFSPRPVTIPQHVHTYTELRQQIHDDLRVQHPEWVELDGTSSMCDSYEARLMELLGPLTQVDVKQPK